MCKKVYLMPEEVENILQEAREKKGITGTVEENLIENLIEDAIHNKHIGDKILLNINPIYVHVPSWQRKLNIQRAKDIGFNYNSYKWGIPKVIYTDGKLYVIDGMHRIFGTYSAEMKSVLVEVLVNMSVESAINLFLEQDIDRGKMTPQDKYGAAIEAGKPEYVKLREICNKNHVVVKGDMQSIDNPVGMLTSITDGIRLVKTNPKLLNNILALIGKLQWNCGKGLYDGKAYSAKVIRSLKKLYAYYDGREKDMERVLLSVCKGSEYFNDNLAEKWQDSFFDYLSDIIEQNIDIVTIPDKRATRKTRKLAKAN